MAEEASAGPIPPAQEPPFPISLPPSPCTTQHKSTCSRWHSSWMQCCWANIGLYTSTAGSQVIANMLYTTFATF